MPGYLRVHELECFVLRGVSLELERSECSSLSGPSGSGKTLLLRALADLDPSRGQVELDGRARESIEAPEWRRRVGYVPAESGWWAPTVREHFRDWTSAPVARLGLEPALGEAPVAQLSSGERQRLALLRLLENEPEVLLLDEPTSALDADATRWVEDLVAEQVERGCTVIWVSHDGEQARRVATRHFVVEAGGVREVR